LWLKRADAAELSRGDSAAKLFAPLGAALIVASIRADNVRSEFPPFWIHLRGICVLEDPIAGLELLCDMKPKGRTIEVRPSGFQSARPA
jgi:hypothetical protein